MGDTARALVIHDGKLLLMERWRDGLHYFSIPGGHIEAGETPEQTAVREVAEETTVAISIIREVVQMHDGDIVHHIFLAEYLSGTPHLPVHSEESHIAHTHNRFMPDWVDVAKFSALPLVYWEPLRDVLVNGLTNGFPDEITVVPAAQS
jgi:8-oxo-dGTP pyrophosphatase MutT (NUDIX family)